MYVISHLCFYIRFIDVQQLPEGGQDSNMSELRQIVCKNNLLVLLYQLITPLTVAVLETTFKHAPTCVDVWSDDIRACLCFRFIFECRSRWRWFHDGLSHSDVVCRGEGGRRRQELRPLWAAQWSLGQSEQRNWYCKWKKWIFGVQ
jgi:hypothetical protein